MDAAKTEAHAKAREAYANRKEAKLEGVVARKSERAQRSPQDQLALLDKRLGKDTGAQRERARLQALLDSPAKPKKKKKSK